MHDPESRMSDQMGRAGSSDAQYGSHRAGASGKFSQRDRMGRIYRCGDPGAQYTGSSDRLYLMGKSGAAQRENADESEAFDLESSTSKPAVGIPRIFRKQAVQSDKCFSGSAWRGAGGLAD